MLGRGGGAALGLPGRHSNSCFAFLCESSHCEEASGSRCLPREGPSPGSKEVPTAGRPSLRKRHL